MNGIGPISEPPVFAEVVDARGGYATLGEKVKSRGFDVRDYGAVGDNAADNAAAIQAAVTAAADTAPVVVPPGTYLVSVPIENVQSMDIMAGATIKASAYMAAVLRTSLTAISRDNAVSGKGTIDADDYADTTIHARYFERLEINGLQLVNAKVDGIKLGDAGAAGRSAEAVLLNLHIRRVSPLAVAAGSVGIREENCGDNSMSHIIVSGYEKGVYVPAAGGGMFSDIHVWTPSSQGRTTISFEDHANLSQYVQCHADTPANYGFHLYGYQTTLVECGTYNNPNDPAAVTGTGTVVGIRFEGANATGTIIGHYFYGAATTQLKADVECADGIYTGLHIVGSHSNEVITDRAIRSRLLGLDVRDALTSGSSVAVNASAASANAALDIQTGGLERWKIGSDGGAEAGANAGSGFSMRRYSDAGALLGEVLAIARASGTITIRNAIVLPDGVDISIGSTTGSKIGTNSVHKIGFFGATPVVKPASIGAIDATVTDTTWGAEEKAVLDNTRQRLQYLEWRLQALGLLG